MRVERNPKWLSASSFLQYLARVECMQRRSPYPLFSSGCDSTALQVKYFDWGKLSEHSSELRHVWADVSQTVFIISFHECIATWDLCHVLECAPISLHVRLVQRSCCTWYIQWKVKGQCKKKKGAILQAIIILMTYSDELIIQHLRHLLIFPRWKNERAVTHWRRRIASDSVIGRHATKSIYKSSNAYFSYNILF